MQIERTVIQVERKMLDVSEEKSECKMVDPSVEWGRGMRHR